LTDLLDLIEDNEDKFAGISMYGLVSTVRGIDVRPAAILLVFVFCQVVGLMCVVPHVAVAGEQMVVLEEPMGCPMEGTIICPPSAVSSPERQVKNGAAAAVDQATILLSPSDDLTLPSVPTQGSRSSALSIVPISIGSSSVLRI
jgi:hypothetical protein